MKKSLIIVFVLFYNFLSAQIVKGEETYYLENTEGKKYVTYHYVEAQYSMRSYEIFVVNDKSFEKIKSIIPKVFAKKPKQDFTDLYVLGISDFDKNKINESDEKIIDSYLDKINKYRMFYNLSIFDREFTDQNIIHYLSNEKDLCLYMICPNEMNKK